MTVPYIIAWQEPRAGVGSFAVPIRNDRQTTTGEMKAMRDDIRSMETRVLLELRQGEPPSAATVDKPPPRRSGKRR